ncbi:MAG: SBBP repeat-containing protein [Candidatus Kapabacteria bacterium]|nr:SBBP repeat-containing protein [Candidatus Kapabacteria bacterium]
MKLKLLLCSLILVVILPKCLISRTNFTKNEISFIENKGQIIDQSGKINKEVLFIAEVSGGSILVKPSGISFTQIKTDGSQKSSNRDKRLSLSNGKNDILQTSQIEKETKFDFYRVDMEFKSSNKQTDIKGLELLQDYNNYYLSQCPEGITHVRKFKKVRYENVYDKIDFVLYVNSSGKVQYDFIVKPGANPQNINFAFQGAESIKIKDDGSLIVKTPFGDIEQGKPHSYQDSPVQSEFILNKDNSISFKVGDYDQNKTLTIDPPTRIWGTYYQGNNYETGTSVAVDSYGNVYMAGEAFTTYNIATTGAHQSSSGGYRDGYIVKFNSDGERQWGTYYGGSQYDQFNDIIIDASNNIYAVGQTSSNSAIATPGSHQSTWNETTEGFIVKFNTSGVRQWGTYYGGYDWDWCSSIDVDASGNIYVTGTTMSNNGIATAGSHQSTYGGDYADAFLVKFNSSGVRQWGTYYGQSGDGEWVEPGSEEGISVSVDPSGYVYLGGHTYSQGMATAGSYQSSLAGGSDVFLVKFNSSGVRQWATYYGGSGEEFCNRIDNDSYGNIYISGITLSTNGIATTGAHQTTHAGGDLDGFLVKLNSSGSRQWATYYGGDDYEGNAKVFVESDNKIHLVGSSYSTNQIATTGSHQSTYGGGWGDGFWAEFNSSGVRQWGSYYGGYGEDKLNGICVDNNGDYFLSGSTTSYTGIATEDAHQTEVGMGEIAAFLVKFGGEEGEPPPTITITNVSKSAVCCGDDIQVTFTTSSSFGDGNIFDIEISNPEGNFLISPLILGSFEATEGGTFTVTVACSTDIGDGHRIRIVSTFPEVVSADNGSDIKIVEYPTPQITGEFFVCPFNSYIYRANEINGTYKWLVENGTIIGSSTNQQVEVVWNNPNYNGTIKLIETNEGECTDSISNTVIVFDLPKPTVYGDEELCLNQEGDYFAYISSGEFFAFKQNDTHTFKWVADDGGTIIGPSNEEDVKVLWHKAGLRTIKVIVTDLWGCADSVEFEVLVHSLPEKPEITSSLDMLMSNCTDINQWYLNGNPISGANNYIYFPTQTGYYQVQCMDENGCESELSDVYFYQIASNSITITSVSGTSFCTGNNLSVTIETTGSFTTGNVFSLQLSDRFGSFLNPTVLATMNGPLVNSMNATLPHTLLSGNAYRLRVISTNPAVTGTDNGSNITIGQTPTPQFTGNTQVCINQTIQYSANQFDGSYQWQVTGGTIQGSSTSDKVTVKWGNTPPASITLIETSSFGNCQTIVSTPVQFVCFPPDVLTVGVLNLSGTNANLAGNVTDDNGSPVTQRGICWSIYNSNPTIDDYITSEGTGLGEFNSIISNLPPGTTIFFRAYGINEAGIGYGDVLTLTTPSLNMIEINLSPKVVCEDQPADLGSPDAITGGSGEYNIRWIPRTGLINEFTMNPTLLRARFSGYYILEVTDYQTGEYAQSVMLLLVKQKPDISLPTTKYTIKRGESVNLGDGLELRNGTPPFTYLWTDKINFRSEEANPRVTPQVTTRYFLTVTDVDGCFSDEWTIIVQVLRRKASEGSALVIGSGTIQIYPNPATSSFVVNANFDEDSDIDLKLFDILGRETISYNRNNVTEIEESFNIEGLTSGIYLIKLRINGEEMIYKLIKP